MEQKALRQGILEKATKDVTTWKARRCVLRPEALWYSPTTDGDHPSSSSSASVSSSSPPSSPPSSSPSSRASSPSSSCSESRVFASVRPRGRWTLIPLRDCVQLVAPPHDTCSFLLQTRERSHYWRAKSQTDRDAWLLALATQCISVREVDLLTDIERRICEGEERQASAMLQSLKSAYRLEGTLSFSDTKELLEGFVVDFYRTLSDRREKQRGAEELEEKNGEEEASDGKESKEEAEQDRHSEDDDESQLAAVTEDCTPPTYPLEQVLAFIRSYDPRDSVKDGGGSEQEEGRGEAADAPAAQHREREDWEGTARPATEEEGQEERAERSKRKEIWNWLDTVVFPRFMSSPIIQRRIAQLAASRTVVSWGCDPLRSPLLCSIEHTGGFSR
ncbi:UNVERIFIED_CONTAM: hypothetical protein HHA_244860 [Hammondia hammondi]|eukprot:XP_008884216.1 hypothetical protein HHA_244860 [Hammondia hammondi]